MAIKSDSNLPILTHDVVYSHRCYALNDKLPQAIRAIETTSRITCAPTQSCA